MNAMIWNFFSVNLGWGFLNLNKTLWLQNKCKLAKNATVKDGATYKKVDLVSFVVVT